MYSHLEKIILALVITLIKLRHYFEIHPICVKTNFLITCVIRKQKILDKMSKWEVKLSKSDLRYKPKSVIKSHTLAVLLADFSTNIQPKAKMMKMDQRNGSYLLISHCSW